MTMTDTLPVQLSHFLDGGGDLTALPDIENYARFVANRDAISNEDREALIDFFLHNYAMWERGGTVTIEGVVVERSLVRMRHALWMAEVLHDDAVAERFLAALPDELRDGLR